MITQQEHSLTQQENEKLRLENIQLKENLEKEEFLHKTLYKQWSELNIRMLSKEREFNQFKRGNVFYKYAFFLILLAAAPVYYFISSTNGDKRIATVSQPVSPAPVPTTSKKDIAVSKTTKRDVAVQPPVIKREEKEIIQPDTIQPKPAIVNKPAVIVKPLTDSVRNLIYSEGWDAYYEKSDSHYPKSSQKYKVWLEGWKDAENDDKKMLTKKGNGDTSEK